MERLCGWIEKGYRFEIKVPTTIYDALRAEVTVYRGKNYVVDKIYSPCKSLPKWNESLEMLMLSRRDDALLKRRIKTLIDELS